MASSVINKNTVSAKQKPDIASTHKAITYLLLALILPVGVYSSQFFHILDKPLFSLVYSGNLNLMFFSIVAAVYIFGFFCIYHYCLHKRLGLSIASEGQKLSWSKKAVLYFMTLLPIIATASVLNFKFKIIYELGTKISKMSALGNGMEYLCAATKLLCVIYMIFLVEKAADCIAPQHPSVPYGGIAAMLTFGTCEFIFNDSKFVFLYALLFLYYGVIYLVSEKRFGVTFGLALILYIL